MFIRRGPFVLTIAVAVAIGLFVLFHGRQEGSNAFAVTILPSVAAASVPATAPPVVLSPAVQNVTVANFAFSPSSVTIPAGTTVHWVFSQGVHTTTSGDCCNPDGTWDSDLHGQGSSFDFTFNTPGTYPYFCQVHGAMMTGSVTVTPSTAAGITITGQVRDQSGRGLKAATVRLTDEVGETRSVQVGRYGYYMFTDVPPGHTYQISAVSRRYAFTPMIISVTDDLTGVDFTAESEGGPRPMRKSLSSWMDTKICGSALHKST